MKRTIAAGLALLAVVAISVPAQAQYGWNSNNQFNTNGRFHNYDSRYDNRYNGGLGFGSSFGSSFGGNFGDIDNTQARLQARITAGINSGRLTQREAAKLQAKLSQIATVEARLRASGNRLSFSERSRLQLQLSKLSADITAQMNDYDHRRIGWNRGGWR